MAYTKFIAFITLSLAIGLVHLTNETAEVFAVAPNPCVGGRGEGFARDLMECGRYFYCDGNGNAFPGVCDYDYVFDAETQMCVTRYSADQVCFKCSSKFYELMSVPHACQQFIQCFNGRPTLHLCSDGLVYDGRSGIRQCNTPPYQGGCHRENPGDVEQGTCPQIYDRPIFLADHQFANV